MTSPSRIPWGRSRPWWAVVLAAGTLVILLQDTARRAVEPLLTAAFKLWASEWPISWSFAFVIGPVTVLVLPFLLAWLGLALWTVLLGKHDTLRLDDSPPRPPKNGLQR